MLRLREFYVLKVANICIVLLHKLTGGSIINSSRFSIWAAELNRRVVIPPPPAPPTIQDTPSAVLDATRPRQWRSGGSDDIVPLLIALLGHSTYDVDALCILTRLTSLPGSSSIVGQCGDATISVFVALLPWLAVSLDTARTGAFNSEASAHESRLPPCAVVERLLASARTPALASTDRLPTTHETAVPATVGVTSSPSVLPSSCAGRAGCTALIDVLEAFSGAFDKAREAGAGRNHEEGENEDVGERGALAGGDKWLRLAVAGVCTSMEGDRTMLVSQWRQVLNGDIHW